MKYQIVKIGLLVDDMEAALSFYRDILGMAVTERFPRADGGENIFLDAGNVILELMPSWEEPGTRLHHLAVGSERIEEELEWLKQRQVPVSMEHTLVEADIHLADIRDPENNRIRLFCRG